MQDITPPKHNRPHEDGLKMISHCPVCHYNNSVVEAKVLEESHSAHLVYIKCKRCQSAVLALFSMNSMGMSSIGVITDFDSFEIGKFKNTLPVNSDDILAVHKYLRGEDNLSSLFL